MNMKTENAPHNNPTSSPPGEIRTDTVGSSNEPCWIVRPFETDRVSESDESGGWISLLLFKSAREMDELIGGWGTRDLAGPNVIGNLTGALT